MAPMMVIKKIVHRLHYSIHQPTSIAPLVIFRLVLGALLFYSTVRTWQEGWIKTLYIDPSYHFSFVPWIQPLEGNGMYLVFSLMALASLGIFLGLFYRLSTLLFFLLFVYVELLDKAYYLNHYYLVSLLVFWMLFVPAHRWYSLDAYFFPKIKSKQCAQWHILIFKIQLSIVYFFAGLAKVNPDWLYRAQPLATWLPGRYELPFIGSLMHYKTTAFLFSWAGCFYDMTIWGFLWLKKTRSLAYLAVLAFHVLTGILFPRIGMFPYIMICSTLIFFSAQWHERLLEKLPFATPLASTNIGEQQLKKRHSIISTFLFVYLAIQLYLPLRHLQYPGNLFWHERGYRFSWRVMLMEKNGYTAIIVKDPQTGIQKEIEQEAYLSPFQRQQMRSQPDMMWQFAQHIGDTFKNKRGYAPEIYIKSRLSLNGRRSQAFTNESIDVYTLEDPVQDHWILPLKE